MQTIKCYRCNHEFDTDYAKNCLCKACRVSISVPDARRHYVAHGVSAANPLTHAGLLGAIPQPMPNSGPSGPDPSGLPPPTRDPQGKPYAKPTPAANVRAADDASFIKRRMEQLAKERTERVARDEGAELERKDQK